MIGGGAAGLNGVAIARRLRADCRLSRRGSGAQRAGAVMSNCAPNRSH